LVAEQFASFFMDEMKPGAAGADHGLIFVPILRWIIRQPMLHVYAGLWTFEKDVSPHARQDIADAHRGKLRMFPNAAQRWFRLVFGIPSIGPGGKPAAKA
jgi:hypothetical protein